MVQVHEDFEKYRNLVPSLRIIAGTYEGILYGIDVILSLKDDMKINIHFNPVWMFESNHGCIHTIAIGGRYLVCGGVDEVIKLYDLRKKKDIGSLHHQSGTITGLVFSSFTSPKFLISVSDDGTMAFFRTKDWLPLSTIKTHHGRINSISIHPSGKIALTVGSDKNIRLWNMMTGKKAGRYNLNKNEAFYVQWNTLGTQYAVLLNKEVMVYDMSATLVYCFSSLTRFNSMHYTISKKNHEILVLGSQNGCLQIYDSSNGKLIVSFVAHENR
ncbi:hypothetical protein PNEG_01217 [Pneumocystis murina B123]|uniref:Uncharacterized protein n=1 Tax=Pneumocystis murina (strain B123) TaxID=1069680 RepID=M7P9G0_PNEMU|nr:hypothetical protein PNEG_01217 [Pneumocystis murina B123]EMR10505.1 hypothetical protein PNEG_01217 [Pneumocystis murina B123]